MPPRKRGKRYPCGKLKRPEEQTLTLAEWKRCKSDGAKLRGKQWLASELGRRGCLRELSDAEVAAGFRVAAIYRNFERSMGLQRSARSPAYSVAHDGAAQAQVADDDRDAAAKSDFNALQDEIAGYSRGARAALEQLCVDDQPISGPLFEVRAILAHLARKWGIIPKSRAQPAPAPGFDVLALSEFGRASVLACFTRAAETQEVELRWSETDFDIIDKIRTWFAQGRHWEEFPDDTQFEQWRSTVDAADSGIAEIMRLTRDPSADFFWQVMGGRPEFHKDHAIEWLSAFRDRYRQFDAIQQTMRAKANHVFGSDTAFTKLVRRLAQLFESKGLRPTAASDMYRDADPSPAPSPFVGLVALVIGSVPEQLQASPNSLPAFSKAVSRALARRDVPPTIAPDVRGA
jgi:hypothetical protein